MMKLGFVSILITVGTIFHPSHKTFAQDWNLIMEENGIKLFSRPVKGFEFKEVRAVLNLDVDLEKAKNFLMNPVNIEKWMSGCTMSIAKTEKENHQEYYAIFDAPWPISDRDDYGKMMLKEITETKLKIAFQSMPNATPEVSSLVRVPYSKGHLEIKIADNNKKVLTYQFLVDRGGSLPSYVKDYLEKTSPVKTVQQLKYSLERL